ncbi:MAG: ketohexokinase [Sulfuriflexus sp.]|nr:ketohexokinase [Sulfuriflexus sp.]
MAKVLCIGIATLDWVQVVAQYPAVDSEVRAEQQYLWRGGNATNTLVVLSQLGEQCSWFGTLADDAFADLICADLDLYNINYSFCPRISNSASPTSHILLSGESASRNIVHYRDLRELNEHDSDALDFSQWDWIHFEGRNIKTTLSLMQHIKQQYPQLTVSLEIEKTRDDIEQLYEYADCLLFGRGFVESQGYETAEIFLKRLQKNLSQSCELICAWGSQGAMALSKEGVYSETPAIDIEVVDTRAAGDVFNAGYIHTRLQGSNVVSSVEQACRLASLKCGQLGLANIVELWKKIVS